ncbi:hypothetical protein C8Q76DRAFT_798576 [Earliella scabrosa]|nr:hypothetical protein C8Q76DRAFT_798576 [Earliella scabrosa]
MATTELETTIGVYLIGTFLGTMLYGFVLHQAYRYARLFPTDSFFIRLLVTFVIYYYLVSNYFNPGALTQGVWSLNYVTIVIGVNMFLSQLFFVRRVYLMGSMYCFVAAFAMFFFIVEIGLSAAVVWKSATIEDFGEFNLVNDYIAGTFGASVIGDTLLTGSLMGVLYRSRSNKFNSSPPEPILNTVVTYVVNTGLLHDVLNVVSLCLAVARPSTLSDGLVSIVNTKLYAITLLTVLNSRHLVVSRGLKVYDGGEHFGMNILARADHLAAKERWNVPQVPDSSPAVININVTTEMEGASGSGRGKGLDLERGERGSNSSTLKHYDEML